jgi:hypothetical protein
MVVGVRGVCSSRNTSAAFSSGLVLFLMFLTFLCSSRASAQSQVFQRWVARIDAAHGPDQVAALTSDNKQNVLVVGSDCLTVSAQDPTQCQTTELLVEKYDINGNRLWGASLKDVVNAVGSVITTDAAGNVYVGGLGEYQTQPGTGCNGLFRFITVKYSATGQRQWIAYFTIGNNCDGLGGIGVDPEGNSYITGSTGDDHLGPDVTIKYDPNGKQLWAESFNAIQTHFPKGLVVDKSGNVYITGSSGDNGAFRVEGYTVKYDTNGNLLWSDIYLPTTGFLRSLTFNNAITLDAAGNAYVAGQGEQDNNTSTPPPYTAHIIKYGTSGNRVWVATHQTAGGVSGGGDFLSAVALDAQGNVFATGSWISSNTFPPASDFSTLKFNSSGVLRWQRRYTSFGRADSEAAGLGVNSGGDVYVTGKSTSTTGAGEDFATVKYDTNGNQLWVVRYDGPGHGDDVPANLVLDGGDVIVAGTSVGSGTGQDWATVAYVQDAAKLTPASLTFGSQAVGTTSAAQPITLTNTAETTLIIHSISAAGDFSETNNCPGALAPMDSCTIEVSFHPTGAGTRTGTITVADDWAGSPRVAQLTGTGK